MKKTKINIISGFLGSGKTTFIKKIINEANDFFDTVIIENEFGEVSIDGNILEREGIKVKEINAGCICCSVSDDFSKTISEIKRVFDPEKIIIEPSGVGKLSEIMKICNSDKEKYIINNVVTVIDANRYFMHLTNFGEFYIDQIKNSKTIIFSRYTKAINNGINIDSIIESILEINPTATILNSEWDSFDSKSLLDDKKPLNLDILLRSKSGCCGDKHEHKDGCCGKHEHNHDHKHGEGRCNKHHGHSDDHCGKHEHNHDHKEGCCNDHSCSTDSSKEFESITIKVSRNFEKSDLEKILSSLSTSKDFGQVIRSKGSVPSGNITLEFDLVPEEINIIESQLQKENFVVIIGKQLNTKKINSLFF